jgi:hypothetical protein
MIDAGYRFFSMTLGASNPGPDCMIIAALLGMTILTLLQFEDFDAVM